MLHDDASQPTTPSIRNIAVGIASALSTIALIFVSGRAVNTAAQHAVLLLGTVGVAVLLIWWTLDHRRSLRAWAIGGIVVALAVSLAVGGLRSRPNEVNEQVVKAGDTMMAKEPKGGDDAMMEKDAKGGGDAMMEKDAKGDAMMDKEPTGDAMSKDEAPTQNVLLTSGSFQPLEHAGSGTASIINTVDDENVLTLTGFSTDSGPDLEVWLVKGNPANDTDVENGTHISLGKLKGTSGNQQYVLPANVDPLEFTHAYVWCRAFSVGFTRAKLV